jgi:hypothetical protein
MLAVNVVIFVKISEEKRVRGKFKENNLDRRVPKLATLKPEKMNSELEIEMFEKQPSS